jgi:hypothetical protein
MKAIERVVFSIEEIILKKTLKILIFSAPQPPRAKTHSNKI